MATRWAIKKGNQYLQTKKNCFKWGGLKQAKTYELKRHCVDLITWVREYKGARPIKIQLTECK